MTLANITPGILDEYLALLVGNHPSYVVRPLSMVESQGEALEVELEVVDEATYLDSYVKLSGAMKASTADVEVTTSGRRVLARSPSGKALPSGYLDRAAFEISPRDRLVVYLLPQHPSYERLRGLVESHIRDRLPLADAQHLVSTRLAWMWV